MFGPHRLPCETPEAHRASEAKTFAPDAIDTRWVLPVTILGSSLPFIDGSVVNVALPAIGRDLGADLPTMQWVMNGYMLTLASLILIGGAAGDRFGRRRVFMVGLIAFAAASAICGLAPSAAWLVVARLLQGAAAALLVPSSLAIIGASFTGAERGPAIGTWAAAGALTTALGPVLGGWLVDHVGWRAIFFINVPIAAVAVLLAFRLPNDRHETGDLQTRDLPLDLLGALLTAVALGLLSYGLVALGEGAWRAGLIAVLLSLPVALLFIRAEAKAAAPMMPLSLFRDANFSGANALTLFLYAALTASLFLLPLLLINVHGYSATAAGAAFLPFSIIMGVGSRYAGRLVDLVGARWPLIAGPSVTAVGFALLGMTGNDPNFWRGFFPGLVVVGIGMTISVAPLTTVVLNSAPNEQSGIVSGINNAVARAAGLVAVAALGLAFGGAAAPSIEGPALAQAYRLVMFVSAALAVLSAVIAAGTIGISQGSRKGL
ncbi:MFS transporter [Pseudorhodoplanes sinuspersici]|uniref:MFS transporter n=1 Tax=Pseudorhodoplanes sinuspersici TaxID=1235591 RepID=A0A1W6ZU23_9HYPH|nr:MFS transporter [Pseudorhodoplanes sinuspersici]ARQ00929.1 MFS transporter [Pseudorhodoplanes sinuspersici]RKE72559.1 EmrB/QacA subfamily drug resistance transporter [Pseudorhodoplanes sinuspersici]